MKAVPDGYQQVPIYNFIKAENHTHISSHGCQYAKQSEEQLVKLDQAYEGHLDLIDKLKQPISKAFGLNDSLPMKYYELVMYADTIVDREFEGLPLHYNFTKNQMD